MRKVTFSVSRILISSDAWNHREKNVLMQFFLVVPRRTHIYCTQFISIIVLCIAIHSNPMNENVFFRAALAYYVKRLRNPLREIT